MVPSDAHAMLSSHFELMLIHKNGEDLTHSYLLPTLLGVSALLSGIALGTEKSPKAPGWRDHVVGCVRSLDVVECQGA